MSHDGKRENLEVLDFSLLLGDLVPQRLDVGGHGPRLLGIQGFDHLLSTQKGRFYFWLYFACLPVSGSQHAEGHVLSKKEKLLRDNLEILNAGIQQLCWIFQI